MDVYACGHNGFNQLDLDIKDFHSRDKPVIAKSNLHNISQHSVLEPSCQLSLSENENVDNANIDIHFTWSRCILSVKRGSEKVTTYVAGSLNKEKTTKIVFENTICSCSIDGSGIVLLRDNINPDKLSVLHCGMSQSVPLTVKCNEEQKSGLNLQNISGGHKDIYTVYDGVSFGKFQLPQSLEVPQPEDVKDVIEKEVVLTIQHIDFVTPIKEVSCGKEHVLLLSKSGSVYSYGLSSRGQLGHGEIENETSPRLIDALDGLAIRTVVAGGWHSVAVSDIGDMYVWGWNESGQLGLKSIKEREGPANKGRDSEEDVGIVSIPICLDTPNGENVKDVACGSRHTIVLTETGQIFACGWNGYGQLGQGDTINRDSLTRIGDFIGCRVFAGHWNSAFVCKKS